MRAEVIAIGDELTSGQRLDTNSQWIAERLGELGVAVLFHTTVADDLDASVDVFKIAAGRADIIVATGGLGPTADDLTREALAAAAGVELVLDSEQLAAIERLFALRGRHMPERNRVQALFPRGSRPIANPHGTAPGIDMTMERAGRSAARVFALPGVPAEMREMWHTTVAPAIQAAQPAARVIAHRRIKCFGTGESHLEAMLPDLVQRGREPSVGITVHQATITLRVTAHGATTDECAAAMQPTIDTIRAALGPLVFGDEDDELEHVVARLLAAREKTLSVAEWGTGGLVGHWLAEAATSGYFGGVVVQNIAAAMALLNLAPELADRHGPISAEVTAALATGCRDRFRSDYALAVGAFPPLEVAAKSPPRCYIALAGPDGTITKPIPFAAHPDILKDRTAKEALNLLRLRLLKLAGGGTP